MNRRPQPPAEALDRWLAAERSGHEDDAEAALADLLGVLPGWAPSPGFADRVMARVLPAPHRRRLGWRALAASGLAAAASLAMLVALLWRPALAQAPAVLRAALGGASVSKLLQRTLDAIVGLSQWIAGLVDLGDKLLLLARAMAKPLATPPVAILAAACGLVSILALRCLYDLIQRDRRWVYADPI
jgi:hypothetical protein